MKNDTKKVWRVVNGVMGRVPGSIPAYLEVDDKFISKPLNIDNYFNYYFYVKINTLWTNMAHVCNNVSS